MEKEIFNKWNNLKKEIENKKCGGLFKEREIFYINVGKNNRIKKSFYKYNSIKAFFQRY